ncbi:MAG: CDP-alcohol phosphatidyltransferase family protein [Thermodesulfobacteriota bacterium]
MKYASFKSVPDLLSFARLLLVPVIWALAALGLPVWTGVVLLAAGLTDVLDGIIARRWGVVTAYGSRLDSIADTLMEISAAGAVILLRPDIVASHWLILSVWVAVEASSILLGWIKFRRIGDLHLYLSKAAGIVAYGFVIYTLVIAYNEAFFYAAVPTLILASLECLLLQLFARSVDEHMRSIYHAYRAGRLF